MSSFNYTTSYGETWGSIAYKMYNDVSYITTLIQANPLVPIDTILPVGIILIVPIIDDTEITTTTTPPWK